MSNQRTVVVTGSASGMGAATVARLEASGHRVIGVDLRDADVIADLSTPEGRVTAIEEVIGLAGGAEDGSIDGLVTWAGVAGLTDAPGSLLASVNYFGSVAMHEGLRPLLARGDHPAAVTISSNSTTIQPGIPLAAVDALLAGDEAAARSIADEVGALVMYPVTKTAISRWTRRNAPTAEWAGAGITLNAVAPGPIETPMLEATRHDPTTGQFVDALPIPVGRPGTADEAAALVEFLLGPDARFICGSVLFVDGGLDALLRADDHPTPWEPVLASPEGEGA